MVILKYGSYYSGIWALIITEKKLCSLEGKKLDFYNAESNINIHKGISMWKRISSSKTDKDEVSDIPG